MRQVVLTAMAVALLSVAACTQSAPQEQAAAPQPAPVEAPPPAPAPEPAPAPAAAPAEPQAPKSAGAGPVIVFESVKGKWEIETYPNEAPKTVEHILGLVRRNFYNGIRVHRVVGGFVVQYGDPQSRDMSKRDFWGTGGSGSTIGVGEFSPRLRHTIGMVAIATPGDVRLGDSQMYVMLGSAPQLNNQYTIFGKVISGMDVVQKLEETDVIRRATVRVEAPATN